MKADAILDLLLDVKHDLGKYLIMPIALLPRDADDPALRAALERALRQTRCTRGVTRSAREIWRGFHAELSDVLAPESGLDDLRIAIERALSWEQALARQEALDRAAVERDFGAVQAAIAVLIDEARSG
jgi:hypothetical protein